MKYIKSYQSYKEERVNEEFVGSLLKAATGAFKNFLTNLLAPFKTMKDDFKKGMKMEEVKKKISIALDSVLKNATQNINKAKDEKEMNDMTDAFMKEIDEKMIEFDKEIKSIKESKIFENASQDTLIGARVMFGMLKNEFHKRKQEFDKKFAEAKDLAAKKTVAITRLKSVIEGYKKKISDENMLKQATDKYKEENNIEATENSDAVLKSYEVEKIEDIIGKEVKYKREDYDDNKKPEEQKEMTATGEVKKVDGDQLTIFNKNINKEIKKDISEILAKEVEEGENSGNILKTKLGEIKDDPEKMKKVADIVPKIIDNIDNQEKLDAAAAALS